VFLSSSACSDWIKLQSAEFVIGRKLLAEEVPLMVRDVRLQMASHTRSGRVNDEGYWLDTGMQFNLGCLQLMARSEDKYALLGYQKR